MNESQVRKYVKSMYPLSNKWSERVDKMSTQQLYAIHRRQLEVEEEERELAEKKREMREALLEERPDAVEEFLQASLF
jgi:hypothetical protein